MLKWFKELDHLLRGQATQLPSLRQGTVPVSLTGLTAVSLLLSAVYGFFIGWFALLNREVPEYQQLAASMVKVPLLFFLTLLITFPSLYVFNALVGSRLTAAALLRLLGFPVAVTVTVVASVRPIVGLFAVRSAPGGGCPPCPAPASRTSSKRCGARWCSSSRRGPRCASSCARTGGCSAPRPWRRRAWGNCPCRGCSGRSCSSACSTAGSWA